MRLDVYLQQRGLADSRERAKRLILSGDVTVDGVAVTKPAFDVVGTPEVTVSVPRFVGRGGEKLEGALQLFEIDPAGKSAIDIGASTGGFTDCLLQHGAASVVAVDAGFGQLHPMLRNDPRVRNIEKYNARELSAADVGRAELAVMDVSFISQTYILPRIPDVVPKGGLLISLIKPQFEAGRGALNKQGVVREVKDRIFAVSRVLTAAGEVGLYCVGLAPSPILGGDGNEEFLACFRVQEEPVSNGHILIEKTVREKVVMKIK
ncbi:MAG: TlyA family RNA methyltransferase [Ruminococcaceae bacterium]|nr:TlyA family RNA methyltransferase [Oscillospiraceae bacterium]